MLKMLGWMWVKGWVMQQVGDRWLNPGATQLLNLQIALSDATNDEQRKAAWQLVILRPVLAQVAASKP